MEGHLGTDGGLEIPRGFRHPGSSPQSIMPRLPAAPVGKVRLLATVRQVERATLFIVTVLQTLYPSSLSPTPVWEHGGGPRGGTA